MTFVLPLGGNKSPLCTGLCRARIFIFRLSDRRWEEPPRGSLRPIWAVRDKFTLQSLVRSRGKRERRPGKHSLPRGENPIRNNGADVAELVDARDLKSLDGNVVWVRVPPPAPVSVELLPIPPDVRTQQASPTIATVEK